MRVAVGAVDVLSELGADQTTDCEVQIPGGISSMAIKKRLSLMFVRFARMRRLRRDRPISPLPHHPNKRFDLKVAERCSDSRNDVCFLDHETEIRLSAWPGDCRPGGLTISRQADDPAS
jgi:hypothetical protein